MITSKKTKNKYTLIPKNNTNKIILKTLEKNNLMYKKSVTILTNVIMKSGNIVTSISLMYGLYLNFINTFILDSSLIHKNYLFKNATLSDILFNLNCSDLGLFIKQRKVSKRVRKYSKGKLRFKSFMVTIRKRQNIGHY